MPGVAAEWEISDDLLTFTFHLRRNAKWSNGDPVTAHDFEWNWKRLLTPGTSGEQAPSYNHSVMRVVGAESYLGGETDDFSTVGVKAHDDTTLEITLEAPNENFLIELANFQCLPLHPATMEEVGGQGWLDPDVWVSNGAYVLGDFRINQGAVLLPNDQYWDKDSYHLSRWEILFNDGGTTADLLSYENDDIDITGRIEDDLEAVTTSDVGDELVTSPMNQIRQLVVMNSRDTRLNDVRVRKALALAIDREAVAEVGRPGEPGTSMIPDSVPGGEQVPGVEYDVDAARSLLADAGYPDGDGMPTITVLDYQSSPWVEATAQMWRDNLGIDVTIDNVERGLYMEKRHELHPEGYSGFYAINVSVSSLQIAAQRIVPSAATAGIVGLNLVPPDVAQEVLNAEAAGAPVQQILDVLDANRYPAAQRAIELAREALALTDPQAKEAKLVECAIARDEAFGEIPVLWGGYNLLVKPRVKNLELWPFGSVLSTKGVTIEG
ncbi:peptide ABC transporter substrate-binding protein [Jiangella asiatica]|uniref:peptide ABC transporter substrate-binding protein n=1 Tax=Jiangella asiatica TaxID=2530372 RepID=UPI0013A5DE5E|nr:peptide ABC transporter substrate-binding protein [Jiangella asiatica]